jgi:hypothetical protein
MLRRGNDLKTNVSNETEVSVPRKRNNAKVGFIDFYRVDKPGCLMDRASAIGPALLIFS